MEAWRIREIAWKYNEKIRRLDERIRILGLKIAGAETDLEKKPSEYPGKREESLRNMQESSEALKEQSRKMKINVGLLEDLAKEQDGRAIQIEVARRDLEMARHYKKTKPKKYAEVEAVHKNLLEQKRAAGVKVSALIVISAVR